MTTKNEPNNLSKKRKNTAERIIQALEGTQGLLSLAARRAGVSYATVKRYAAEFPTVKIAVQDAKSSTLDFAEGKLYQAIAQGNLTAIIFYLKTHSRARRNSYPLKHLFYLVYVDVWSITGCHYY